MSSQKLIFYAENPMPFTVSAKGMRNSILMYQSADHEVYGRGIIIEKNLFFPLRQKVIHFCPVYKRERYISIYKDSEKIIYYVLVHLFMINTFLIFSLFISQYIVSGQLYPYII